MKQKTISSVLPSPLSTLFILCVAILSQLTFVSCKDEDLTEEEKQQKQEQENDRQFLLTSEFWQVIGQLSSAEVLPDDWQNATFEPGIGEASDKSATTRIVPTNDAAAAAESFEHLTGADVTGLDSYEWKRDFGTLTYQRLYDGTGWATVDVDIKQMPGLKRIVYCTPEQQGLNANVPGVPYYRFGDVIKKENNGVMEYWVCVRPCFGPEKKGDMHWMCLGSLPDTNIKSYTYKGRTWYWPVSLTTNYEHIKNLSEMTSAILYPVEWADHYESNQNKNLFHDFSYANIKYHNRYFWQLVQRAWDTPVASEGNKTIFQLLFHRERGELEDNKQLNYFYGSASGPSTWSWYMNLNLISVPIRLSEGFKCRDLVKKTSNKSCETKEFDIREYSEKGYSTKARDSSFIEPGVYVYPLRYATGKQLFGSQPGYYQTMEGSNGIHDVYVFNKHYGQATGSTATMTVFNDNDIQKLQYDAKGEFYGTGFWRISDVVKDKKEGSLWFCIQPSGCGLHIDRPSAIKSSFLRFNKAWFVSLTPGHYEGTDQYRTNLVTAEQAKTIAFLFYEIWQNGYNNEKNRNRATEFNYPYFHLQEYAKVNLRKLMVIRDSLHNQNGPDAEVPFPNHVGIYFTNIAYSDARHAAMGKQGLMRCIFSNAGLRIEDDGSKSWGERNSELLNWSVYEGGNHETIFMQDLASSDKVKMYAAADRWVTLPWFTKGNIDAKKDENGHHTDCYEHQPPRTAAYDKVVCSDFDWSEENMDFKNPSNRSMYNEPILFFRIMAVHDIGAQELTSIDGRELEVVHLAEGKGAVYEGKPYDNYDRESSYTNDMYWGSSRTLSWFNFYNGVWTTGYYIGEPR